jgi:hypothetical protein
LYEGSSVVQVGGESGGGIVEKNGGRSKGGTGVSVAQRPRDWRLGEGAAYLGF